MTFTEYRTCAVKQFLPFFSTQKKECKSKDVKIFEYKIRNFNNLIIKSNHLLTNLTN